MPRGPDERKKFSRTSEKVKNCLKRFKTEFTFRNCQNTEVEIDFRIFPVQVNHNGNKWAQIVGNGGDKNTWFERNEIYKILIKFTLNYF